MVAFLVLCALVVAAVLGVAALLARVDRVDVGETVGGGSAQPRYARVQRATDPAAEVRFRLAGTKVTISAGRDAPGLGELQGRRLTVQCAFLADRGAILTDGRVRWPRGERKVTAALSGAPGREAQFCSVQRSDRGAPIAQAVFPAVHGAAGPAG